MRALFALLIAVLLALPLSAAGREVRVGIYDNAPKVFHDANGQPTGIFVDLLREVARENGWTLQFEACQWEACLEALRRGEIDLMPDVAYSEQRDGDFDFHPTPAMISWSQLYHRPEIRVLNYLDLQGKRIAVLSASVQERFLTELLRGFGVEHQMVRAGTLQEVFSLVESGKADVAVANHLFGGYSAWRFGLLDSPIIFNPSRLHFATAEGRNADLLARIDLQLQAWQANHDSIYYNILRRWQGSEKLGGIPPMVWWALAALGGGLVLVGVLNVWLRREVARKVASLNRSESRFRTVFDSVSEAIFVHERESGRLLQVNKRMCEMYGCTEAQALSSPLPVYADTTPPYDAATARHWLDKAVKEGPQVFEWQARRLDDGRSFWVEVSLRAVDLDDKPCVLAVVRDIGERKAAEAELLSHREHLEEMVEQRTLELQRARAEAEHLAKAKSDFLANMSHEIRTPLTGVLGFAHLGRQRFKAAEVQHLFARIIESGQLLQRVIDDILDFSKMEAGKLAIESLPFDPAAIVDSAYGLVRERAEGKGLRFICQKSPHLPARCKGDPLRIEQVLLNLLSNAVKFTERGSVVLSVDYADQQLLIGIEDTGIGMSAETQGRLFRAFEQADSSTTRRFGGTGLGLAISHRLLDMMGGSIQVESRLGEGSVFRLSLPCPALEWRVDAPQTVPAGHLEGALAGVSVLVAEDNEINRILLSELLEEEGIRVDLAENGLVALEKIQANGAQAYDLVLMDVMMPVMDGHEATRRLRELAPDLPVLGQTAHAMEDERLACLAAGMVDRVTKPIDPETLFAMIRLHARKRPA